MPRSDYFGARYYSPTLGRFMTPDWSAAPDAVPYADLANPQFLNLYSYVLNSPVSETDADGHICCFSWTWGVVQGAYGATVGTALTLARHPVVAVEALENAALHPIEAIHGGERGVVTVAQQIAQGDPRAIGAAFATLGMAVVPGLGEAGDAAEGVEAAETAEAALPAEESQLGHIFRDAAGHLPDTPENRALIENVANDAAAKLGTDRFGNTWSARTLPDGSQLWTESRGGRVINGRLNAEPRTFNPENGLSGGGNS